MRDLSRNDLDEPVVVVPIEESIDLHVFHPSEILAVVDAYLEAALERGYRGPEVERFQGLLANHFGEFPTTGVFDARTELAVRKVQEELGIDSPADLGIASYDVWQYLAEGDSV